MKLVCEMDLLCLLPILSLLFSSIVSLANALPTAQNGLPSLIILPALDID